MPSYLRDTRRKDGCGVTDLATTLDRVAKNIDDARGAVEHELIDYARSTREQSALARTQRGVPISTTTPPPSAAHTGAAHNHDLLCVVPDRASLAIREIATFFWTIDEAVRGGKLPAPSLPSVSFRAKPPREGERLDVERTIAALVGWIREHAPVAWDTGVGSPLVVAPLILGACLHDKGEAAKPVSKRVFERSFFSEHTSKRVAVFRALDELVDALDSPLKRAVRASAQIAFATAGALNEIVMRIERENPTVTWELVWLPNRTRRAAPLASSAARFLPVPTALAMALVEMGFVADQLQRLDEAIRVKCLTSPSDHAQRGAHSDHVLFLSVIRHLERGRFDDEEIALLVADGFRKTPSRRAERVYDNLAVGKNKTRDLRTRHLRSIP